MNNEFIEYVDPKLCEKYYRMDHESGLNIIVFPKEMTLKTALLGVRFGSVYEEGSIVDGEIKKYPAGIAHFLEHKLFSSADGVDAFEKLASIGADANAYTSNNKTVYMFSCTENFDKALEELINFVYNPYFTAENVKNEQGIITQEIKMYIDSPYDVVSQNLLLALYGDCKLSNDVLGTQKTIRKITDKTLYDCYDSFYRYSNMALVVSGNVDPVSVLETVDKALPKKEKRSAPILPVLKTEESVYKPYIEKRMKVGTRIFEIGIKDKMPSIDPRSRHKRDVAMTILDEMLFSRAGELYNDLFEGGFINESYSYGYSITRDAAFHSIYAEGEDPQLVLDKVKDHVNKIKKEGLSENDFIRCKRVMMAEFVRDFDSVDDIANAVLNFKFEDSDVFAYRKIIQEITFEEVCECLEGSFGDGTYALSVVY